MRSSLITLALIVIGGAIWVPAQSGRPPVLDERAAIESVLANQGYIIWEEIEFDDGLWEIDNAVTADGRVYDLKLDPETLRVVEKDDEGYAPWALRPGRP